MIVVGGTYDEFCFEPSWEQKFGSGLRACRVINSLSQGESINYYTFGDDNTELYLNQVNIAFPNIVSRVTKIKKGISFHYDHPLITPRVLPRLDTVDKKSNNITVEGDNILYYGMIEGSAIVKGKMVVYDPQSPINPLAFSESGSSAEHLAVVVNYNEASHIARSSDLEVIKQYFFSVEKAEVLVVKMGPKGALVATKDNTDGKNVPVYKTHSVWPIGSGDVFASAFAYYWFKGTPALDAAHFASWVTAQYCNTKNFNFSEISSDPTLTPIHISNFPKGQVYLAGPFFTYAERWLIDQIRTALMGMKMKVFSPWHDIGHGLASEVVAKDLEGLHKSSLVFAVLDGLDSGTLFEIGYAVSKDIPVIAYVENESEESVKMLEGTACILERDLTTAVYKALWTLAKNE